MNEADKILKMIEEVDPSDTDTLDEIDAYAHILACIPAVRDRMLSTDETIGKWLKYRMKRKDAPQYTRSRDALKTIRPDGYNFDIECSTTPSCPFGDYSWDCTAWKDAIKIATSNQLPTEELAELHAIIQAIQWERNNIDAAE